MYVLGTQGFLTVGHGPLTTVSAFVGCNTAGSADVWKARKRATVVAAAHRNPRRAWNNTCEGAGAPIFHNLKLVTLKRRGPW